MTFVDGKEGYVVDVRKSNLLSPIRCVELVRKEVKLEDTAAATSRSIAGTTTTEKFDLVFAAHLSVSFM